MITQLQLHPEPLDLPRSARLVFHQHEMPRDRAVSVRNGCGGGRPLTGWRAAGSPPRSLNRIVQVITKAARLTFAALALGLVVPAVGSAHRDPLPDERRALLEAVDAPPDSQCYGISVSTARDGWASVWPFADCAPDWDDQVIVLRARLSWEVVAEWQSGTAVCPPAVPSDVGQDLRWGAVSACLPASRRVYVPRGGRLSYRPSYLVQGAHGVFENLRWQRWGTTRASGRGFLFYSDRYSTFRLPVRIALSRRRPCGTRRTYRRITIRAARARDRARLRFTTGTSALRCPDE